MAEWLRGELQPARLGGAGKLRDELLGQELFGSLAEAAVLIEQWRRHYNESRPHSALGYLSPAAFAATLIPEPAPALS